MILLDTHVLIWLAGETRRLSPAANAAIRNAAAGDGVAISAISLWELAWLAARRRLQFDGTLEAFVHEVTAPVSVRPLTEEIACMAAQFPIQYPADPADRLIGATALFHGMPLVTKDTGIRSSGTLNTIW